MNVVVVINQSSLYRFVKAQECSISQDALDFIVQNLENIYSVCPNDRLFTTEEQSCRIDLIPSTLKKWSDTTLKFKNTTILLNKLVLSSCKSTKLNGKKIITKETVFYFLQSYLFGIKIV